MGKFLRALGSGIGITVMVAVVLSAVLWFLGGFFQFGDTRPFATSLGTLVGLAVLWIVALIVVLVILLRSGQRDDKMADDIVSATAAPGPETGEFVASELSEMRDKLKKAMTRLRKSKMGRRHLYELPWYIIIGPPGAGKTTAIVNSGLQFPLADEMGKGAIGGVGGTRNCDWWFTDGAVLVDTAGRYTTQESDAEADNAAWLGFLGLLKKHRKRQPINGALIAISLSDLSMQDELTQKAHATAVRRRLHELREKLGVRFPVYVLFTKADLIAGFTEFYERLGKEGREQVWGFTLPLPRGRGEASPIAAFDEEFGLLLSRLNAQSLDRMQEETDQQRRSLIATFPVQVASVRTVARDFLTEVFQENRYEHRQLLRGVYLTSGTQEGMPIDRLMMGMARTFGIGRQAIGSGKGTGRSYFLTRLFDSVIFREAGLVSADDRVERRYRWTLRGAIAAAMIVAVGTGFLWGRSYLGNKALLAQTTEVVQSYRDAAALIPKSPVADTDLAVVVPALDILRTAPVNPVQTAAAIPPNLGWGLFQGRVVGNQIAQTYRAALNQHLLPRLLLRLEDQMQSNVNDDKYLYETLKVYLMLGQLGPMNREQVATWMVEDWARAYPGAAREDMRASLEQHLGTMLSEPMEKIGLNDDIVRVVRGILAEMPQARRVYENILTGQAAKALPKWRLTDVGGPSMGEPFVRSSGLAMSDGLDGIYTYAGFHEVFLQQALEVAKQLSNDGWVLGPEASDQPSQAALLAISRDVFGLYFDDYAAKYEQVLADLDIVPMDSIARAVNVTQVLSGANSPFVKVLEAVARETRLTVAPMEPEPAQAAPAAGGLASAAARVAGLRRPMSVENRIFLEALISSMPSDGAADGPAPLGAFVEKRFEWLHRLVDRPEGQPSQLDSMVAILFDVYQELSGLNRSGGVGGQQQGEAGALSRFIEVSAALPGPMQRWATQIAAGSGGATAEGTRAGINARWQSSVLQFCEQATANSYPFNRRAQADIGMRDFSTLFAPGGSIDVFFDENLAKFVDTRTRPWTFRPVNETDLGISANVLEQMMFAADIRDAFFGGGPAPQVDFQITPYALDPAARGIMLEIDGIQVGYRQGDGQPRPVAVSWPGQVGLARVTFDPLRGRAGPEMTLSRDGPWAWFRLLDGANLRSTNAADRVRINFSVGGMLATFEMQLGSVRNPFALAALSRFKCPKQF